MIRPEFKTYRVPSGTQIQVPDPVMFESENIIGGMFTDADPGLIPNNSLVLAKNLTYTKNRLVKRNGLQIYAITKPDSNAVLAIFAFNNITFGIQFLRFTATTINRVTSSGWVASAGPALVGSTRDRYSFAVADNRLFFSNNGANVISEYLPATNTYVALGDAPAYRFITSAFNRIVGASLRAAPNVPYQVGWSGDLNYSEWNPVTDISAGNTPLVNSPSDLSDDITGIYNLSNVLCIPRQRSIWLATNLPSATNPFNFFVDSPRIGCDTPYTIQVIDQGLVFYSYQHATVYQYSPGIPPKDISQKVKRQLKLDISSVANLYSSYDYNANIYSLYIFSDTTSIIKCYSYHFEVEAWTYEEYTNVASVTNLDYASSDITIDGLTGTINSLLGTIDSLGAVPKNSNKFYGFNDGTLCTQPVFSLDPSESVNIITTDNGATISSTAQSKSFFVPGQESVFDRFTLRYTPYTTGILIITRSKDDGSSVDNWKLVTVTSDMLFKPQSISIKRPVRATRFQWAIISESVVSTYDSYSLKSTTAGDTVTST